MTETPATDDKTTTAETAMTTIEVTQDELCLLLANRKEAAEDAAWRARRKEAALQIDVETCHYSSDECTVLRWSVSSSCGWIEAIDLPDDKQKALHARIEREAKDRIEREAEEERIAREEAQRARRPSARRDEIPF
jgi:hypothetical protein